MTDMPQLAMPPVTTPEAAPDGDAAILAAIASSATASAWDERVKPARMGAASSVPPRGYVCRRCGKEGHYIQNCDTNGDPQFDRKRKYVKGVPVEFVDTAVEGGRMVAQEAAFARKLWFLRDAAPMPDVSVFTAGAIMPPPRMPTKPIASRPRLEYFVAKQ